MAGPAIRVLETLVPKGPGFRSCRPGVWMPGFEERLVQLPPSLEEQQLGPFVQALRKARAIGLIDSPGDRRDEEQR